VANASDTNNRRQHDKRGIPNRLPRVLRQNRSGWPPDPCWDYRRRFVRLAEAKEPPHRKFARTASSETTPCTCSCQAARRCRQNSLQDRCTESLKIPLCLTLEIDPLVRSRRIIDIFVPILTCASRHSPVPAYVRDVQ